MDLIEAKNELTILLIDLQMKSFPDVSVYEDDDGNYPCYYVDEEGFDEQPAEEVRKKIFDLFERVASNK